ncbi:PhzF family phenazine biosynthesis protein [Candidatus Borrarchaeum sp.]|uniref:PhzF family phenazine biosynthesis protein n=1 Tax=Candidatus Borrarchaeum sp. TaxID=2846742 RepID=UPI002580F97B|nr:PhzF family phenazine biosynthesis protein [Candidatus Borrarchaeum sp.]
MKGHQFYIVDVFAEKKYTGNQLAVFRDGYKFSDEEMQLIAKEMHFSETTFILSDIPENNGYDVRIFTPASEVPFAGHPTLGTAYIIQREIIKQPIELVNLNLKVGQIPIDLHYKNGELDNLVMKQKEPTFGSELSINALSTVLNIDSNEIDNRFPIQEVSTGVPFIIVPIRTLKSIKRINVNTEEYFRLIKKTQAKAVHVFCPETQYEENHVHVRMFAYYYGVPEDPATGSAAGCLAAYLVKHRYYGQNKIDIRAEQGYEIGRPSLLFLNAEETENKKINVYVGGQVQMIAKGEFL